MDNETKRKNALLHSIFPQPCLKAISTRIKNDAFYIVYDDVIKMSSAYDLNESIHLFIVDVTKCLPCTSYDLKCKFAFCTYNNVNLLRCSFYCTSV